MYAVRVGYLAAEWEVIEQVRIQVPVFWVTLLGTHHRIIVGEKGGEVTEDVYDRLAKALDKLPNGFPQTPSRTEIQILRRIFTPDEAALAGQLTGKMETLKIIARRAKLPEEEMSKRLKSMAKRGLLWYYEQEGKACFRLAPFMVGIYESQRETLDHELAHLVEKYMAEGGAAGIMKPQPALHRVIPAQKAVKSEWILPYDDVKAVLLASKTFHLQDCICRVQQDHIGRRCTFPLRTCLSYSVVERTAREGDISKEEALEFLDKAEEIGLVHTVSNVMKGFGYVCNCCGCCCAILRGITDWGIENSVAYSNYHSVINPDECLNCGICVTRCQVHAIIEQNGVAVVNRERCIGCGLCVTGCPNGAAQLERKPESQMITPPMDFKTWEQQRLVSRGLSQKSKKR